MKSESIPAAVIVERRQLKGPWAGHAWMPVGVFVGAPEAAPWTVLDAQADVTRFFAGSAAIDLVSSDTATYRENLQSGAPKLWVVLSPSESPPGVRLHTVTADPAEGEAMTESGSSIVEALPMPPEIVARLAEFVAANHVERGFFKRKRDSADPEAMGRRPGRYRRGGEE